MGSAIETVLSPDVVSKLLVLQAVMLTLAVISFLLRVLVKYRRRDCFGLDDIFALLAVLFFVAIEAVIWCSKTLSASTVPASGYTDNKTFSRTGIDLVLFWSVTASSQLSIFWFYRFVCSRFSWAKILLASGFTLTISGWAAFTICDSLNLVYTISSPASLTSTGVIRGYRSFESASMMLEALCSFFIFWIQLFRLHHVREKLRSKYYLVLVPFVTIIVVATGALRLVYFMQQNVVSEMIWSQTHLGVSILCTSVPVYAGLETLCCITEEAHSSRLETWMPNVQPQTSSFPFRNEVESPCCDDNEDDNIGSIRPFSVFLSQYPSIASPWSPISRKHSSASSQHGRTREIIIEPEKFLTHRAGAEFLPARRSSQIEKATKRFKLEE